MPILVDPYAGRIEESRVFNGTTGLLYLSNDKIYSDGLLRSEFRGGLMRASLNWTELD